MRQETEGLTLREIIDVMLQRSGLIDHYKSERDGADRIENLEELVNAAESFVTQEGFGRDAVALPVDELGASLLRQSPASQGLDPSLPETNEPAPDYVPPDADTGETLSPLAAFLTHAALESGDNQAQAGQEAVQLMTVHSAKGLEFDCVFVSGWKRACSPASVRCGIRRRGGRAAPDVRGDHPRPQAPVPELFADAAVARADALQRQKPLLRRAARSVAQVADPEEPELGGSAFGYGMGYPTSRSGGMGSTSYGRGNETFANPQVPVQRRSRATACGWA